MENNANTGELNPEASLKLIYEMIDAARTKIGKNYFYYLFWGYLVASKHSLLYWPECLLFLISYPVILRNQSKS